MSLSLAVFAGNLAQVQELIAAGANVNAVNENGGTPLFTASSNLRGMSDNDPLRMGSGTIVLDHNVPLTSVTSSFSSSIGDNAEGQRTAQEQWKFDKQASFGSFERHGREDPSIRPAVHTGLNKKDRFREIQKLGHQMNAMRTY